VQSVLTRFTEGLPFLKTEQHEGEGGVRKVAAEILAGRGLFVATLTLLGRGGGFPAAETCSEDVWGVGVAALPAGGWPRSWPSEEASVGRFFFGGPDLRVKRLRACPWGGKKSGGVPLTGDGNLQGFLEELERTTSTSAKAPINSGAKKKDKS